MRFTDLRRVFFSSEAWQFNCFQPGKVKRGQTWTSVQKPSLWEQSLWHSRWTARVEGHLQIRDDDPTSTKHLLFPKCKCEEMSKDCFPEKLPAKKLRAGETRRLSLGNEERSLLIHPLTQFSLCPSHILAHCSKFVSPRQDRDCFSIQLQKIWWPRSSFSLTPTRSRCHIVRQEDAPCTK